MERLNGELPGELHLDLVPHLAIPHVEQYFGFWAVQDEPFRAAVDRVSGMDLRAHVETQMAAAGPGAYDRAARYPILEGGVAQISLSGPLMKYVSSVSAGTSTVLARRQIRNALANDAVRGILLHVDSPGGTVAGTQDLADEVAAAAKRKPVVAYIEDLGASGAYWPAAQAHKVYVNAMALVGSIGTYSVIYDLSAQAAKIGVKVYTLRAGQFKGAGVAGTEVTPEQLAEWQRLVNELNAFFVRGVSTGRRLSMDKTLALADGRIHVGQAAVDLGLADGVKTFDQVLEEITTSTSNPRRTHSMSSETNAAQETVPQAVPTAASYQQLKTALPSADAAFLCGQLDAAATLDQARAAWMGEQQRRIEAADKKAADAEASAKSAAAAATVGVKPVETKAGDAEEDAGDAEAAWNEAVAAEIKAGKPRPRAVAAVVRRNPELHQAMLAAHNARNGRPYAGSTR